MTTPPDPVISLEVTKKRCGEQCGCIHPPGSDERPMLVIVRLNQAAKSECLQRTGQCPSDAYACVNMDCGALFRALHQLAPLQDLVK